MARKVVSHRRLSRQLFDLGVGPRRGVADPLRIFKVKPVESEADGLNSAVDWVFGLCCY